ncbi:MAG: glycosyltransferase [Elusimicrobiales bacterium]|jgi:glycosyltransferase involved in cell wall biosynthesis
MLLKYIAGQRPIRVLQLVEDLKVGGLERFVQALAVGLPNEKFEVLVWCLTKGGEVADELRAAGVKVEVLGMGPRCGLRFLFGLRRKIAGERVDILHAHGYPASTIGRVAGILARVPVIIAHVHSTYWHYTIKDLFRIRLLALFTDRILCCSKAVAEYVRDWQKNSSGKVVVLYNSASDMRSLRVPEARAGFGLARNDFVVGVAASLRKNKGHACFLKAMAEVIKAYPGAKALLAGVGPLRDELERYAGEAGIGGNIVFCGLVRRMEFFYSSIDVLVQPSIFREGLAISILEAMSAELPVIGSDIGGIPEAVTDGKTGIIVPPGDPAALAGAVMGLIRDRQRGAEMGRAGRAVYEAQFTHSIMIEKIKGVYDGFCR